ncbi:hypothetical protein BCVP_CDS0057 [Bacillus phage BC-VP]|nr:hypothetical protein BCVP_CDS0057 [Bacillus phage BC-VP]
MSPCLGNGDKDGSREQLSKLQQILRLLPITVATLVYLNIGQLVNTFHK